MPAVPVDHMDDGHFSDVAHALRKRLAKALARWEQIVREVLPKADELTFNQLRDHLPAILNQVADTLEKATRHGERLLKMTECHGELRFNQSYNLDELLVEYDLLRPILIEEVTEELGRLMDAAEVVALENRIGLCARRSVLVFVEHQSLELKTATEAQSKYLSFLSHDLRGGLNGVFLMIEVLRRELQGEDRLRATMEDLDAMRRSLLETVGTMDRFLHAERFRKGKVQVHPASLNVKQMLAEITAHFSYQAKEKGLSLAVQSAEDCQIVSDRELLTMILQNLIANAIKYSSRGEIRVSAERKSESGVLISVRDEGPGMPAERLKQLFTPFTRGETYGQPGVGLGLSIARQAAELLGARLWAESTPGVGSTFFADQPSELSAPAAPISEQ